MAMALFGRVLESLPGAIRSFLGDDQHSFVYVNFIEEYLAAEPGSIVCV